MPSTNQCMRLGLVALLLTFTAGCGANDWPMNEQVEGMVKLDGGPLANAIVEFMPDVNRKKQAPVSRGTTDDKGHFVLACDNKKPGAVIGKHNVLVHTGRVEGDGKQPKALPGAYSNPNKTPLKLEVTADQHTYDLKLSEKLDAEKK